MPDLAGLLAIDQSLNAPTASGAPGAAPPAVGQSQPAPVWTPPAGVPVNNVPVIDVTAAPHPGAVAGQPGSQLAPSQVDQSAAPTPGEMPTPNLDATMARLRAANGGGQAAAPAAQASPGATAPAAPVPMATTQPAPAMAFGFDWSADPKLAANMQAAEQAINDPNWGKPTVPPGKITGNLANAGAATSEGVAGTLGFLPDQVAKLLNLPIEAVNAIAGTKVPTIQNPVGGTQWWENAEGLVGANPQNVVETTRFQQLMRPAVAAATGMLVPALGAEGLAPAVGTLASAVRDAIASGMAPSALAAGASGGLVGQLAQEQVPEQYKPLANFLGQLAGGGLAVGGEAAMRGAGRVAGDVASAVAGPLGIRQAATPVVDPATGQPFMTGAPGEEAPVTATPWQRQTAGASIARAAGQEPGELAASIPPQPNLVPGVQHTMGTLTGDPGLLSEERRLQTTHPAAFNDLEARNSLARVVNLENLAPAEAREAASQWARAELQRIQSEATSDTTASRDAAGHAMEAAGAGPGLPGVQDIGRAQQAGLEAARLPVKARLDRAFAAFDPDGTLAADASAIGTAARRILEEDVGEGGTLKSEERGPLQTAAAYNGVLPVKKLTSLLGNTVGAMREIARDPKLGRESIPYRRMSMLADAINGALADAAGRAAEEDVAGGAAPGERIIDHLDEARGNATGTAPQGHVAGGSDSVLGGEIPPGGTPTGAGPGGNPNAAARGTGRPGGPGSDQGVAAAATAEVAPELPPSLVAEADAWLAARRGQKAAPAPQALTENLPPDKQAALRAMRRDYAIYKDTFRKGVVGDVIRPSGQPGQFATGAAEVPGMVWQAGPKGAGVADELIGKLGQDKARQLLGDYPALTLRNDALRNGEWNDAAYQRWRAKYAPVLAKFPEIAQRFATAADAQRAAEDAAIRGQRRVEAYENSAARFYLGRTEHGADLHTAIDRLVKSENAGAEARQLIASMKGDDAAVAGVQRNLLEYMAQRARSTSEAGTTGAKEVLSGTYQKLIANPKVAAVARAVLTPDQWRAVQATGRDLELAARLWNATKIKGSPGTAADLLANMKTAGHPLSQILQALLVDRLGETLAEGGLHMHGLSGVLTGIGAAAAAHLFRSMRAAGFDSAERLQIEGQLNPALGRVLLQDAVKNPKAPILRDVARRIVTLGAGITATTNQEGHHP